MTQFNKTDFNFHGGYLTYTGDYSGRPVYEDKPGTHPTRVGTGMDLFIARFKYRGSPLKMGAFKKFLINNFTVEEYAEAVSNTSPLQALKNKGFAI